MKSSDHIVELRKKFEYLESVLLLADETNWISGIRHILNLLSLEDDVNLQEVLRSYQVMNQGVNSFNDYYIVDKDFTIQKKKNLILDDLRTEIWSIIS